ncbi:hypothetical protein Taro_018250 [Colocasia esculenta]|uniref:Pentatricopeptide repeat-containing protein n=1 Tax=Colocasia esculenta TaxID=4460 RepID=A0A843UVM1_COLES|nr:hypothetical protein [Colocasia esculenta]
MAAPLTRKTAPFTPPRCFSPHCNSIHRLLLSLSTNHSLRLKHTLPSAAPGAAHYNRIHITHQLFDVFSKPSNQRGDDQLRSLGQRLTPEAVEAALKDLKGWRRAHELFLWASSQERYRHNCYTYNAMASILSRAGRKAPLKALAVVAVERQCPMTPGALGFLIRCLGYQGLIEEANYMFDNAEKLGCVPNSYTFNCLLEGLAKSGMVDMMESRLSQMSAHGMLVDKYTLTPILKTYCNAGKLECAMVVFDEFCGKGWVDEYVFTILLVSFCRWGEVDKTWKLVERMEGMKMKLNEKTFFILIHGFLKEGRVDRALAMFQKMKDFGFSGDLALYGALINGLCDGRELKQALHSYLEMKKNRILPDVQLISKMISAFCGEGDFVTAKQLLEVDGENIDFGRLVFLYNAFLGGLIDHGDVEGAQFLLRMMMEFEAAGNMSGDSSHNDHSTSAVCAALRFKKTVRPNADSFSVVVCGLCRAHKLDMALELIDDMVAFGCTGNLLMYNNLISDLCAVDRLDESLELLRKLREFGLEPTKYTHNSIFGCLCKRGDAPAAIDLMKEMHHYGHVPWIKHCTLIVKQLCKQGKVDESCKFLDDMVEVGFIPDMIAYSAAIHGLCKIGNVDKALEIFRKVSVDWYLPDVVAHNIIINGFCNAGRLMEAEDILTEMLEKGLVPSVVTYNLMMNAWCKEENIDVAVTCFSKIVDNEECSPTVVTFTILINGLLNAGRSEDALAYWIKMKEKGCSPNKIAYAALIHGLCKCGMEDTALEYFKEMSDKDIERDVSVCLTLLNSLASKGSPLEAFEVLKEMVQKVQFPSPVGKNYQLLKDAICGLCKDTRTSSDVMRMIEEGRIPVIHNLDMIWGT